MENTPLEIERKYIIEMPDTEILKTMPCYEVSEIIQIYLKSPERITHRVRKRTSGTKTVYTETKKIRIDKVSSFEDEQKITAERFSELSENIREGVSPIIKTRHKFVIDSQPFEIDVYPAWKNTAILETELADREVCVKIPEFIKIIREVSGIREYSNASMSERFPEEDDLNKRCEDE